VDIRLEALSDDMFLNTERRCPVILLQDTSTSMRMNMELVNQGLQALKADLQADLLASQRVEIAIVTFGPVRLVQDFVTADLWAPPRLYASGNTPLGEALKFALIELRSRKRAYREAGIPYYRPWIWVVTDGAPTDDYRNGVHDAQEEVRRGGLELFAIGTDNADFGVLSEISTPRSPIRLREAKYREMFLWLSQSLRPASRAIPGAPVNLPEMNEWGEYVDEK
jgi:uncharacterized protein YegL